MSKPLISVFQDTQRLLWENQRLYRLTSQAVMYTHVFPENFETTRVIGCYSTGISVTNESALQAARRLAGKYGRTGILVPVNAVNPGGDVTQGAAGQEEELCRCSNLYPCLMKPELFTYFYDYNNKLNQYYSDRVIYSPNITVFKASSEEPAYTNAWYQVDILSCPAPNLNGITAVDDHKLEKLYNRRIRNILTVAQAQGIQALVLGDFGCRTFLNPPDLVAKAFLNQINQEDFRGCFQEIVFAIPTDSHQGMQNLQVFRSVIESGIPNPLVGKKISILGDSISTYWGSNPIGYQVFYDERRCLSAGMHSVEDTWWMKVIRSSCGELLVNNSYAGSRVSGNSLYAGNSNYRLQNLGRNNESPDVILVAMGINDYGNAVPIAPETRERTGENYLTSYFKSSYQIMLWRLRCMYPQAVIYCATLCYGTLGEKLANPFPGERYGIKLKEYNQVIRECAEEYGCRVADLERVQKYYESMDGAHPSARGMMQLAQGWLQAIAQWNYYGTIETEQKTKYFYWLLVGSLVLVGSLLLLLIWLLLLL